MAEKKSLFKLLIAAKHRVKEKEYWLNNLSGEWVKSCFPYDFSNKSACGHRLETVEFEFSHELSTALIRLSRGSDIRLHIILVTGLNAFLYHYTAMETDVLTIADINTDIVVGIPILKSEKEKDFINTLLVIRTSVSSSMTFKELVMKTRQTVVEAIENRDYPIEILARDLNMPFSSENNFPLLDIALLVENIHDQTYINHVNLNMIFSFTRNESSIHGRLDYNPLLYRETTIEQILNHFKYLLREMVFNVDIPLCEIEMTAREEKKRLLVDFNDTAKEFPWYKTIHELFEQQAEKTPDGVAVNGQGAEARHVMPLSMDHVSITYKELNEKSNRLAGFLRERGAETDSVVGIMMERSIEMIIGIFAILKSGCAYLAIDPDYPRERIDYMLNDCGAKVLMAAPAAKIIVEVKEEPLEIIDISHLSVNSTLTSTYQTVSTNLAYIIYTSGSTGRPKGVLVEHRNVVAYMSAYFREFGISPEDIILQQASCSFDVFTEEILAPLLKGGRLAIASKETIMEPEALYRFILRFLVTVVSVSPLLLNEMNRISRMESIRLYIGGGDVMKKEYFNHLLDAGEVYNAYGPTEASIGATFYRCSATEEYAPPIGKPISNYQVYVMDSFKRLCPIGVPGEICIGGEGVARGYLNRPELTEKKFDQDLWDFQDSLDEENYQKFFGGSRGAILQKSPPGRRRHKIYKTGDLGRWLLNGNIEFLGRMDFQVKIRGFRIELGEIETCLKKNKYVKEAVVDVKADKNDNLQLCAYIVQNDDEGTERFSIISSALKSHLQGVLPDYMVPSHFVHIEKIPITLQGKVDRKSLPAPALEASERYTAPRNKIEEKLVAIWSTVLARRESESIGIDDNFFELGGHSLRAVALISRIHKELDVNVPLSEIFTSPTIRRLALYIKRSASDKHDSIDPLEKREYYRLSSAQKRLYFLHHMAPGNTGYNMPLSLTLGKNIEVYKLESILKQLIARHEALRTSFAKVNDVPVQKIHDNVEFEIEYHSLEHRAESAALSLRRGAVGYADFIENFVRPFDLSKAPLIRSGLIKTRDGNHIWIVDIHHIVSDGTSMVILQEDFEALYSGELLSELDIQYKDFSDWQNRLFASGEIESQEKYWLNLYRDAGEIPRLELSLDYKRPQVFTFAGDHYNFMLERDDMGKFRSLAARNNGTLYMNILAVLNALFYKYTGQSDIIVGSGVAGRSHEDLQGIIGMFVNTLAIRNYPQGEKTYESFLYEVIANSVMAFENQDMQFEELVEKLEAERDTSRNPLFDISMVVQNFREVSRGVKELEKEFTPSIHIKYNTSKFDMTFFVHEVGEDVFINIEYYTDIFKKSTIERLVSHFKRIIKTVIQAPGIQLKDIDILSEEERQQLLYTFNDTVIEYPVDKTIYELFEVGAEKHLGSIAAVYGDIALTYKELDNQASQLARYLYEAKGIRVGDRVGIWMSQSLYRIIGILGILKAWGTYVPLDPALPLERIKYMINDAGVGVVISEKKFVKDLNNLQWECESFHTYLCVNSFNIHGEEEVDCNELMDDELWDHVGETANDEITGGGWLSSYTGEPLTKEEMDEYGNNILKKVKPLLHPRMRVLEIGCASGISMYRIAPRVGLYYGTDLSPVIIDKNRERVEREGHQNIRLSCAAAHEIHQLEERNFDMIIMNSVIQCFHGHNYLRKVIGQCIDLLGERGYLFVGDIMDQKKKDDLVREMTAFKIANKDKNYTTKTDFCSELFVAREYWQDLGAEMGEIERLEFSDKIYTIENELTKFRYDALIMINKGFSFLRRVSKHKYQEDLCQLSVLASEAFHIALSPDHLAYIIYTSGSTGRPKGVMIEHRGISSLNVFHRNHYGVNERDRVIQFANISFDASVWEIFMALLNGACLYLPDNEVIGDYKRFEEYMNTNGITIATLPPDYVNQLEPHQLQLLRLLITAGSAANLAMVEKWRKKVQYINAYGPTEATICSVSWISKAQKDVLHMVPIGKPVANTFIYILGPNLDICPVGVQGELCISGIGLARGYLNRPELTAEKFDKDLVDYQDYRDGKNKENYQRFFGGSRDIYSVVLRNTHGDDTSFEASYDILALQMQPHTVGILQKSPLGRRKLYKTGDLARWLEDGNIEYLGRIDHQVKIRGYRIELGEIEGRLNKIDGVTAAVVVDREDRSGQKYLCAYIVSEAEMNLQEIRYELSMRLPGYMIPAHIIQLDRIPLTPAGKVDRKSLPGPGLKRSEKYAAPGNDVEKKLVEVWMEVLGLEVFIGIDDNFFDLGGHSLKATILNSKIHKVLNIKVPLAEIFTRPTIRELALYIENISESVSIEKYSSIAKTAEKEYYALSSAQKRLYILQQMELQGTAYSMSEILALKGFVELERFRDTFRKLAARHEILRTGFYMIEGEPRQRVFEEVEFEIEYYDLSANDRKGIIENFIRPFRLSKPPLLRVGLAKFDKEKHILMLDMHHIISDGTSLALLVKEFTVVYTEGELPPLKLQYRDYSEWQNQLIESGKLKEQETFWKKELEGEIPVLNLPVDFARPLSQSFAGSTVGFEIGTKETHALKQIALKAESTPYMVLLGIFNVFLSKLSNQEDIVVGTPVAGRTHADLQPIIGMFVNTLALRNYPSADRIFSEFLSEIRERTLIAFENQDYPFEDLVESLDVTRDLSRNPLFDVMFTLLNTEAPEIQLPGLTLAPYPIENRTSKFDLTLSVLEREDKLNLWLEYGTSLFREQTILRFIRYFKKIVFLVLQNPGLKLMGIDLIDEGERDRILNEFNDTKAAYPKDKVLHQLFAEQVERTPDHIAAVGARSIVPMPMDHTTISYKELNEKSDQLAHLLKSKGVGSASIVGIMAERSVETIIGILGILKADGAYLPIEPDYPQERIDYILMDSGAKVLLAAITAKVKDEFIELIDISEISSSSTSTLTSTYQIGSANLAYIIYTSGSSGRPKGVLVKHVNVVRLVKNSNYIEFRETDRILQTGALSFDASTFEIWGSLLNGLTLFLVPGEEILTAGMMKQYIRQYDISTLWLTSPFFNQLCGDDVEVFEGLKNLLVGGDVLSPVHINGVRERFPGLTIINGYGPTENTTFSTTYYIDKKFVTGIPIGKPIRNSTAYIVDSWNKLVPVGIVGELLVGGDGISCGYLNNPELTAEKFDQELWDFQDYQDDKKKMVDKKKNYQKFFQRSRWQFLQKEPPGRRRLYKTGDLACWLPDGNIEFKGRKDFQIKIRGFRVEPGEIESWLLKYPAVKEAVVTVRGAAIGDKYLCAYMVLHSRQSFQEKELRKKLTAELPGYMVPPYFVMLEKMPLNSNGKLDQNALPEPKAAPEKSYAAPRNKVEKVLAGLWSEILGIEKNRIGIDDNFFQLGGHSLKAARLIGRIHKELGVNIPIAGLFETPFIREIARYIHESSKTPFYSIEPVEEKDYYSLSSAQKRMYILQRIDLDSTVYNIPAEFQLEDPVDKGKLEETFRRLIQRHESLRTYIQLIDDQPVQRVDDEVNFKIEYYDLPTENPEKKKDIQNSFIRPFDLSQAPLLRVGLIHSPSLTVEPMKHPSQKAVSREIQILMLDMHHIISDGFSQEIMIRDIMVLSQDQNLPPLPLQYKDFTQWQNNRKESEVIKKQRKYWHKEFSTAAPPFNLPTDFSRPDNHHYDGNLVSCVFDKEKTNKLNVLVSREDTTLHMILMAVLYVLMAKLGESEDIVLGCAAAGRTHPDLEKIIGMFVNTLPIRCYPEGQKRFREFLKEVKGKTLEAFENQDYQFEELIEDLKLNREAGRHPLFDVLFALQNFSEGGKESRKDNDKKNQNTKFNIIQNAKFDIMIVCSEAGNRLTFSFFYRTRLFKRETIERFTEYFKEIVTEIIEDADKKLEDIEMISKEKQNRLIEKIKDKKGTLTAIERREQPAVLQADFDEAELDF
jgi:amino acid adenylation domain-containing protein